MTVLDRGQDLSEALVAILESDTELRALAGRTSGFVVPFNDNVIDGGLPVIAYTLDEGLPDERAGLKGESYTISCACFAKTKRDANRMAARLPQILTWAAFNARSLDVCFDPERRYRRYWPPHLPSEDAPAYARADIAITLLVTI